MSTGREPGAAEAANTQYRQFQLVFAEYYSALCQYAFTFLKDRETSEDIVQEVFTRIWEKNKKLIAAGPNDMRYYLYTAVRNNCLTHLNQEKRMPVYSLTEQHLEKDGQDWNADHHPAHGPDGTDKDGYKALLATYIENLPPKCKEVFLLSRMGQLNSREVASTLEISVKTVENQLWKAMKILRSLAKSIHVW